MSVNLASIRMLKALSVAIAREAGHVRALADGAGSEPMSGEQRDRFHQAVDVADILAAACNEAAEALHEQDLAAIEQLGGAPRG